MYSGAMYVWGWLKQLTRMEEQTFNKSLEKTDSTKREDRQQSSDSLWSFSDLVLVATCFQIDIMYLCNMGFILKDNHHPGFLQIMIMYATWGPALIYMEIFLGQYVQRSCLHLKNMSPLTCSSIGSAMLLTSYFYSVAAVDRLADSYMFLFRSFSSELPWMVCPENSTPSTCIDRRQLYKCYSQKKKEDCYAKLGPELLSTRIYYKTAYSMFANKAILLLFAWLTICIALKRNLSDTRIMVKRLLLFMLILFLCLLFPLILHMSRGLSVVPFFTLSQGALLNVGAWNAGLRDFLRDHAAVRGGWQLIGSHIKRGPAAANLTIYCCALTYMLSVFSQIFSTGLLGVLFFYMKVTDVEAEFFFPKYAKLFSFYPFALGMLQVKQLWSLIYFMLIALSSISFTVINMAILEASMCDNFPVLLRYRGYVKVILCILGYISSIITNLLTGPSSYDDDVVLQIASNLTEIVVLILTFSVGYIYGMERFADDMNFLNGSQPTTYWKICWLTLPFGMLILISGDIMTINFPQDNLAHMVSHIVFVVLIGLALLQVFYQIVMSIKAKNVIGILFQPTSLWGPPIIEDHRLRNTYNPREETKYWRKNHLCTHHCLRNKDFIVSVIFREIQSRTSKVRNNEMLQHDVAAVPKPSNQNQVVIAIDKVSSAQLEMFENRVEQQLKFLKEVEEGELNFHRRPALATTETITATQSMEELYLQIDQITEQAKKKAEFDNGNNLTKVQRISSRTKQRRLPTFVPKETPRAKKILKAILTAGRNDTLNKKPSKVHTYAVEIPEFRLDLSDKPMKSVLKKENLMVSKPSLSRRSPCSKSTSCKTSQRPTAVYKPRQIMKKTRLPVWPLPLNTPRPTVSTRLSRSSSSTSTIESKKLDRQPSAYFLNVRLPPKANFPLAAFSIDLRVQPRSPGSSESSGSSSTALENCQLTDGPVLRNILRSVHPVMFPTVHRHTSRSSSRADALGTETRGMPHPYLQPHPRTSIDERSPPIDSSLESRRPLPRKQISMKPPVPLPRPHLMKTEPEPSTSASEEDAFRLNCEKLVADFTTWYEEKEPWKKMEMVPVANIDQAIQIRVDNLLRGVRSTGRSANQQPALAKAKNISEATREQHWSANSVDHGKRTAEKQLSDQSRQISFFAKKISALGKRMSKKNDTGLDCKKSTGIPETSDETNVEEITSENE